MLYSVHFFNFVLFISSKDGDAWANCLYTKGILYAKVCTRLNHLGAKIEKSPYRGRGANPPPTPYPPLGRYAPSGLVASLPRKVAIFLGIFYLKCWEVCNRRLNFLGGIFLKTNLHVHGSACTCTRYIMVIAYMYCVFPPPPKKQDSVRAFTYVLGRGVGRLWGDKALEGQSIVCEQSLAPPMLCLLRTFRRLWFLVRF